MSNKGMTLSVRVTGTLSEFVSSAVGDEGPYENTSEYVRDLIRRDKERRDQELFERLKAELQIAFAGILAIVVLQGTLDIDRVSVMPFDQVAVVAVHRPHQIGERSQQALGQAPAKSRGFLRQLQGKVRECATMTGAFANEQGLHQRNQLSPVFCRFYVPYNVRFLIHYKTLYITVLWRFQLI